MPIRLVVVLVSLSLVSTLQAFTYKNKDVYFSTDVHDVASDNTTWFDKSIGVSKGKCGCQKKMGRLNDGCQCCIKVYIKTLPDMEACAQFQYDSSAKALDFTVTINREEVVQKRISVTTDTKFCHDYSVKGDEATVCLGLRKISLDEGNAGACMFMQIEYKTSHWDKNIGCIYKKKGSPVYNFK